jgi:methionine synthase II (cobalamin-independent)
MFDERERKLLRDFSDVVRFEIEALHDRYETLKLQEHALRLALVRKGVVTSEEWNSAVTEASAEIAIQLATADITSGRVQERQAVAADLKMYWAAAQEPDGAFLQPVLRVLIKMLNLPEEPR